MAKENEYETYDPEKTESLLEDERRIFFEIILANLEKQIQGANNINLSQNAYTSVESMSFQDVVQSLGEESAAGAP